MSLPRHCLIAAFTTALALSVSPLAAQDLSIPISLEQRTDEQGRPVATDGLDFIQAWQERALDSTRSALGDPDSDYQLLKESAAFSVPGRNMAREFLASLPDARVGGMLEEYKDKRQFSMSAAFANRALAEEALRRPALEASHGDAAYFAAQMAIITGARSKEVRAEIDSLAAFDRTAGRVAALRGALESPTTIDEFDQTIQIADLCSYYRARFQWMWPGGAVMRAYNERGIEAFLPPANGGSGVPLHALARAAFDTSNFQVFEVLEANAFALAPLNPDEQAAVLYWIALRYQAEERHELAIPWFERTVATQSTSYLAACALVRKGQCHRKMHNYLEAAVAYAEAEETYGHLHESIRRSASGQLRFLINARKLTELEVSRAVEDKKKSIASATTTEVKGN